jgi:hypothetical protein
MTRFFLSLLILTVSLYSNGQSPMPDALMKGSVQEQVNAIYERTKVFENYRAVREDMFQKLIGNLADTVKVSTEKLRTLGNNLILLNRKVDSLTNELKTTQSSLQEAVTTKNSFRIFGREVNKSSYNATMWIVVIGLAVFAVFVFFLFKRSIVLMHQAEKELKEMKNEFLEYRKSAREAREKMSMDHFNEIKRLRGGK